MSTNSLNKLILCKKFWITISSILLLIYLYPIFSSHLYVFTYDNLDSNVIWHQILAHSDKIFASNDTIIPNMINGVQRSSYPSELKIYFWLYYFFSPETVYRINAFLIHTVAFISMFIFLCRYGYISSKYKIIFVSITSLFYATIPFWTPGGLTLPLIPLYSFILLNIYFHREKPYEWILLILLPLYSSFILFYIFYITMWGIFLIVDTVKNRRFHTKLFLALFLIGSLFLLTNYRTLINFFNPLFISHRTEFNIFFNESFNQAYNFAVHYFLYGSDQHQRTTIMPIWLPVILFASIIGNIRYNINSLYSILLWAVLIISVVFNIWEVPLHNPITLPLIMLFSFISAYYNKTYRLFYTLLGLQVVIAFYDGFCFYNGFSFISENIHFFKVFNISRAAFIQPFLWAIILFYTFQIYTDKMKYTIGFSILLTSFYFYLSLAYTSFSATPRKDMFTFEQYYAPKLFTKIKNDIQKPLSNNRIISYGIEPAVSLYNGLYTIDGYIPSYPLKYKNTFRMVQPQCIEPKYIGKLKNGNKKLYDEWGSKLYLLCIDSVPGNYIKHITPTIPEVRLVGDIKGMCQVGAKYLLSAYPIRQEDTKLLHKIGDYTSMESPWHIWLYKLKCKQNRQNQYDK